MKMSDGRARLSGFDYRKKRAVKEQKVEVTAKSSRKVTEYFRWVHVRKSKTSIVHSDKSLENHLEFVRNADTNAPLRADTEIKPIRPVSGSHSSKSIQLTSFPDAVLPTSRMVSILLDTTVCLVNKDPAD